MEWYISARKFAHYEFHEFLSLHVGLVLHKPVLKLVHKPCKHKYANIAKRKYIRIPCTVNHVYRYNVSSWRKRHNRDLCVGVEVILGMRGFFNNHALFLAIDKENCIMYKMWCSVPL